MGEKRDASRREMLKTTGTLAAGAALASLLTVEVAEAAKKKTTRWGMVLDLRRCTGCRSCTVACKAEFMVPLGRFNAVVKEVQTGRYPDAKKQFLPRLCNHCEGTNTIGKMKVPPCVAECPEYPQEKSKNFKGVAYAYGATYKRPDGAILFDSSLCVGCGSCIDACPYGARYFNPLVKAGGDSSENAIGKCTFCQHRVEKGVLPACVNTCPGKARIFGDLNDPTSEVSKLVKKFKLSKNSVLLPEENTLPQVYYIDTKGVLTIYKFNKATKQAEFMDQIA